MRAEGSAEWRHGAHGGRDALASAASSPMKKKKKKTTDRTVGNNPWVHRIKTT